MRITHCWLFFNQSHFSAVLSTHRLHQVYTASHNRKSCRVYNCHTSPTRVRLSSFFNYYFSTNFMLIIMIHISTKNISTTLCMLEWKQQCDASEHHYHRPNWFWLLSKFLDKRRLGPNFAIQPRRDGGVPQVIIGPVLTSPADNVAETVTFAEADDEHEVGLLVIHTQRSACFAVLVKSNSTFWITIGLLKYQVLIKYLIRNFNNPVQLSCQFSAASIPSDLE